MAQAVFADLAVTDDQLALAAPYRRHGVNGLQSGVAGFMHALAGNNARGHQFNAPGFFGIDGALAIYGFAGPRYHTPQNCVTYRHLGDAAGSLDDITFLDVNILAHNGHADVVFFKVEHQPKDVARKLDELEGHHLFQTVHACDAVTHRQHNTGFTQLDLFVIVRNLVLDNLTYFFSSQFH